MKKKLDEIIVKIKDYAWLAPICNRCVAQQEELKREFRLRNTRFTKARERVLKSSKS